ncbi:MAG: helix-turn-helix domain-containing protein [Woeseia sp.]
MKIKNELGDEAVLAELAARMAHRRIEAGLTQADLARESGVSKRTVERLEAGASVQLTSFIRLLRTLSLLDPLEALLPAAAPGPMELLQRGKIRRRVRPESADRGSAGKPWRWMEDR